MNYNVTIILLVLVILISQLLSLSLLFTLLVLIVLSVLLLVLHLNSRCLLLIVIVIATFNVTSKMNTRYVSNTSTSSHTYNSLKELSFIPKFPFLSSSIGSSSIPTWILTKSDVSSTIRFFDSSPISPSNRYVAITRVLSVQENHFINPNDTASIVVIDLLEGTEIVVDTTNGWDSQLGAQVQWGLTDDELIYNTHTTTTSRSNDTTTNTINGGIGVITNIFTKETRYLQCGVYHVRYVTTTTTTTTTITITNINTDTTSNDGKFGVSPNLAKIKYTQLGYGIHTSTSTTNTNAPTDDGFYIIDISTGRCSMVVSLSLLSSLIPSYESCKATDTPTYGIYYYYYYYYYYHHNCNLGFHAKWSSDGTSYYYYHHHHIIIIIITFIGTLIMVVVRTLERQAGSSKSVRRQHLFVIHSNTNVNSTTTTTSTTTTSTTTTPLYVISWGSKFNPDKCVNIDRSSSSSTTVRDGNHPNWVPDTHQISMNLYYNTSSSNTNKPYNLVVFDIDRLMSSKRKSASTTTSAFMKQIYPIGSGHPTLTSKVLSSSSSSSLLLLS